jgi:hypothetical protein
MIGMMVVFCCRRPPYWCGTWWKFGPAGWFERIEHEKTCKGAKA